MFNFNYYDKYSKEDLENLLSEITEFQTWQALGLFLTKASWIVILFNAFWFASTTTINKVVFGLLFMEFPFAIYLFRELGFNIGITYTSLLIGAGVFVFIMDLLFNLVDNAVGDIADALDKKQNKEEDSEDE